MLQRLESLADAMYRWQGTLILCAIPLLVGGVALADGQTKALGFVAVDLGIWAGGVATFTALFSRRQGGLRDERGHPMSLIGAASLIRQVYAVGFMAIWFAGLIAMSALLLMKLGG